MAEALEYLSCEERLKRAGTVQPEEGLGGEGGSDLVKVYKYLTGGDEDEAARLFFVVSNDSIGGSEHKIKCIIFYLNTRK